ncbi:MAG: class I SAM-dependent methyltransferase [Patescibacteria group bacterium]
MPEINIEQHNIEIQKNLESWQKKPLLREIYRGFYNLILGWVRKDLKGETVELGSGIGNFKSVYPECIATDIFPNPWIDQVESAYKLSFSDNSVSNLVMFDVFHHLAYPGSALLEAKRVLIREGRVIIFEPYISLFGLLVYGFLHHEPVGLFQKINWLCPNGENPDAKYYAAQGNATRIFGGSLKLRAKRLKDWKIIEIKKISAISYVLSGGFSKPSFYSLKFLPFIKKIEKILDLLPHLFATRILVVLEKK